MNSGASAAVQSRNGVCITGRHRAATERPTMSFRSTLVFIAALAFWAAPADASWTIVAHASVHSFSDSLYTTIRREIDRLSPIDRDEVVWLARCIYSESDRPHEQELVAWVVRNRVETQFRGTTYREVILAGKQFSAFNAPTKRRAHILGLTATTELTPWQQALRIALEVYRASPTDRPFAQTVRHFYSPVSMPGGRPPHWADEDRQLSSASLGINPYRFRFFDDLDEGMSAGPGHAFADGKRELSDQDDDDSGFLRPVMRPSGKVARPRRPTVRAARNP